MEQPDSGKLYIVLENPSNENVIIKQNDIIATLVFTEITFISPVRIDEKVAVK